MSKGKPIPHFSTDEEMERFVDTADLSEYDLSAFRPVTFHLRKKDARVNMRLPASLLTSLKEVAQRENVPYQRLMRDFIERGLAERVAPKPPRAPRRKAS